MNGDGKADFCRRVGDGGNQRVQCTLSTGSGFGVTFTSEKSDWGAELGRAWVDFNGDGRADYCRVIAGPRVACTLSTGSAFGTTVVSPNLDQGYPRGRSWTDANGDGRADFCRLVGDAGNERMQCTLSTGSGYGLTFTSDKSSWGSPDGRGWVDFNDDGRSDYCRVIPGPRLSCTLSTGTAFGTTVSSPDLDQGYPDTRAWTDANGDGKADYCRRVGDGGNERVQCTLSTGSGFGATFTSDRVGWGYDVGRGWVDINGDGRSDYCRLVNGSSGNTNTSRASCTLSTGSAFGATVTSADLERGELLGRIWAGYGAPARCRGAIDKRARCAPAPVTPPKKTDPKDSGSGGGGAGQDPQLGGVTSGSGSDSAAPKLTVRSRNRRSILKSGLRGSVTNVSAKRCTISVTRRGRTLASKSIKAKNGTVSFRIKFKGKKRKLVSRSVTRSLTVRAKCGKTRLASSVRLT